MEMISTEVTVPGFVWDTTFKKPLYVLAVDKDHDAYFFMDNDEHPRRSREHLRACTDDELAEASLARMEGEQAEGKKGIRLQQKKRSRLRQKKWSRMKKITKPMRPPRGSRSRIKPSSRRKACR